MLDLQSGGWCVAIPMGRASIIAYRQVRLISATPHARAAKPRRRTRHCVLRNAHCLPYSAPLQPPSECRDRDSNILARRCTVCSSPCRSSPNERGIVQSECTQFWQSLHVSCAVIRRSRFLLVAPERGFATAYACNDCMTAL